MCDFQDDYHLNYANLRIYSIDYNYFENYNYITKIDLSRNMLSEIPNDTFQFNGSLRILLLSHNRISKLGTCLQPLNNLQILDLSYNKINRIPYSLFRFNTDLINLNLNSNRFTSSRSKSFSTLENLSYLSLNQNKLESLKSWLRPLVNLKYLDLSYNNIRTISNVHFKTNVLLNDLNLNFNPIAKIYRKGFRKLNNLKCLNLSNTIIKAVDCRLFNSNWQLKEIHLVDSDIRLTAGLFDNLIYLVVLNLAFNDISNDVIAFVFQDLVSLRVLNLDGNLIQHLDHPILGDNHSLHTLSLALNSQLITLKIEFFRSLPYLSALSIEGCNHLCAIDFSIFRYNNQLIQLSFSYVYDIIGDMPSNAVDDHFPDFIATYGPNNLENLHVTMIRDGFITIQCLDYLTNLRTLNLSQNNMTELHFMMFVDLIHLRELKLNLSDFSVLKYPIFGPENSLILLSLKCCYISNIWYSFFENLTNLETLNLNRNIFTGLEQNVFTYLCNLKYLNLGYCLLRSLHVDIFEHNLRLRKIHIEYNKLDRVPLECFYRLSSLSVVYYNGTINLPENLECLHFRLMAV